MNKTLEELRAMAPKSPYLVPAWFGMQAHAGKDGVVTCSMDKVAAETGVKRHCVGQLIALFRHNGWLDTQSAFRREGGRVIKCQDTVKLLCRVRKPRSVN